MDDTDVRAIPTYKEIKRIKAERARITQPFAGSISYWGAMIDDEEED